MTAPREEKRRTSRFPSDLRLRSADGSDEMVEMEVVNLSHGGAYCNSQRRFAPMTRLEVQMDLPGRTPISVPLTATAVIVRVEDGPEGGPYRMALWFQEMSPEDRSRLRRFLGADGN